MDIGHGWAADRFGVILQEIPLNRPTEHLNQRYFEVSVR
jgi:hypothetical protein